MRAALYERTGPAADVLQLVNLPVPDPGPGEVRVKLAWSGVNPSDVKSRAGLRTKMLAFPQIVPHSDGAGVIDAIGPGVANTRIGERVWIWNGAWKRPYGTAAQFIVVPHEQAVRLPEGTALEVGACLGIPALTAYHAAAVDGGVGGQTVLVAGGAGAVGHYAIQMVRQLGAAQIITTVSSDAKAQLAQRAGADLVLNYKTGDVAKRVRDATGGQGVDRIIEVDFAANVSLDFAALRPEGTIVVYGSGQPEIPVPFAAAIMNNVRLSFFIVYNLSPGDRARAIAAVTRMLEAGTLLHNIAARLPLAQIVDAHRLVESGGATGNVVLALE